jgi:hypothetical protein
MEIGLHGIVFLWPFFSGHVLGNAEFLIFASIIKDVNVVSNMAVLS